MKSYQRQHDAAVALVRLGVKPKMGDHYDSSVLRDEDKSMVQELARTYMNDRQDGINKMIALERLDREMQWYSVHAATGQERLHLDILIRNTAALVHELEQAPHSVLSHFYSDGLSKYEARLAEHYLNCKFGWLSHAHTYSDTLSDLERYQRLARVPSIDVGEQSSGRATFP